MSTPLATRDRGRGQHVQRAQAGHRDEAEREPRDRDRPGAAGVGASRRRARANHADSATRNGASIITRTIFAMTAVSAAPSLDRVAGGDDLRDLVDRRAGPQAVLRGRQRMHRGESGGTARGTGRSRRCRSRRRSATATATCSGRPRTTGSVAITAAAPQIELPAPISIAVVRSRPNTRVPSTQASAKVLHSTVASIATPAQADVADVLERQAQPVQHDAGAQQPLLGEVQAVGGRGRARRPAAGCRRRCRSRWPASAREMPLACSQPMRRGGGGGGGDGGGEGEARARRAGRRRERRTSGWRCSWRAACGERCDEPDFGPSLSIRKTN